MGGNAKTELRYSQSHPVVTNSPTETARFFRAQPKDRLWLLRCTKILTAPSRTTGFALQPVVQRLRDREGALVEHRTENPNVCRAQALCDLESRFAPRGIRFQDENETVGHLAQTDRIRVTRQWWRVDQDEIEFLAQFGQARLQAFRVQQFRRVRCECTAGEQPKIIAANGFGEG